MWGKYQASRLLLRSMHVFEFQFQDIQDFKWSGDPTLSPGGGQLQLSATVIIFILYIFKSLAFALYYCFPRAHKSVFSLGEILSMAS